MLRKERKKDQLSKTLCAYSSGFFYLLGVLSSGVLFFGSQVFQSNIFITTISYVELFFFFFQSQISKSVILKLGSHCTVFTFLYNCCLFNMISVRACTKSTFCVRLYNTHQGQDYGFS